MIQKIYIHYASSASCASLASFCRDNKELLTEKGIYCPQLADIFPILPQEMDIFTVSDHAWLDASFDALYAKKNAAFAAQHNVTSIDVLDSAQRIHAVAAYCHARPHIHSICLFVCMLTAPKHVLSFLQTIQKAFPQASIRPSISLLPPDRELEAFWLTQRHSSNYMPLEIFVKNTQNPQSILYFLDKYYAKLCIFFTEDIPIQYLASEKDVLAHWQKLLNLPELPHTYVGQFCHAKVTSFIQKLPQNTYPHGHAVPWYLEKTFMCYGLRADEEITYLSPEQRKEIRSNYDHLSELPFVYQEDRNFSEYSASTDVAIELEEALEMASLLSEEFCQKRSQEIDISLLPYQNTATRIVQAAILFVAKKIDKKTLQHMCSGTENTTVKDIYIVCGHNITLYNILRFCANNTDFLEECGIYYPLLRDLWQGYTPAFDWSALYGNNFFTNALHALTMSSPSAGGDIKYTFPTLETLLAVQKQCLAKKPHIHSLCLFFYNTCAEKDILCSIQKIQKDYPQATVHCHVTTCALDKVLEGGWIDSLHLPTGAITLAKRVRNTIVKTHEIYRANVLYTYLQEHLSHNNTLLSFTDEKECLPQWQSWLALPASAPRQKHISVVPQPDVIAFVQAVQKSPHASGKRYAWRHEEAFWAYTQEGGVVSDLPLSYLRPSWRKKIYQNYATVMEEPYKDTCIQDRVCDDVSNTSLGLTLEKALILAKLLSPALRQRIVQGIDKELLQYQSQSTRNAYAALLYVEKSIDDMTLQRYTQTLQGICLPPKPGATCIELEQTVPRVAVVTMAYNHKKFIKKNIYSVLTQQTNFSVIHIISDDGSTDGTKEMILRYAAKYPHIKPIFNTYNKQTSVISSLFDQIPCEYVALCDGDDYFTDPEKLQKQVDFLDKNPSCGLCFHPILTLFEGQPGVSRVYPSLDYMPRGIQEKYYLPELLQYNLIQTNSVMYRWRFRNQGLPAWYAHGTMPSDRYWHLLHAECGHIGFQNEIMAVYRRHTESLFYQTEISTAVHRRKYGAPEVILYDILDMHFEGQLTEMLHLQSIDVFMTLVFDARNIQDSFYLKRFLKICPSFEQYIARVGSDSENTVKIL